MKNPIRKILAILMCSILLISLAGCSILPKIGRRKDPEQAATVPAPSQTPAPSSGKTALPEYYHYEPEAFYKDCEKMVEAYNAGKTEEAFSLYEHLADELTEIEDLSNIAYIKYSENVNDPYFNDEYYYENEVWVTAHDRFFSACLEMISGAHEEEFRSVAGEKLSSWYEGYEPMTQEQIDLSLKETELVQQYYSQADTMMDTSCEIGGKEYRFSDVLEDDSALAELNPELYIEIYTTCLENYNALVGETFMELVDVRTKIASAAGYDNYADYADAETYFREYTTENLDAFKSVVKHYSGELQKYTYVFSGFDTFSCSSTQQLLSDVGGIFSEISPLTKEAFAYLTENNLYSIGSESERTDGAYTTYLSRCDLPYLVEKTDGSSSDVLTFAHEFGHFTAFHNDIYPDLLTDSGCLDLQETHSQALELLFCEKAEPLFGSENKYILAQSVLTTASTVIDGCILDDWQREVYKNPDMTLDEINDCFRRVEEEYGSAYYPGLEYLWCDIPHNFEAPMYYISYAISAMGALQIWKLCHENYSDGISVWEKLIKEGAYNDNYSGVMENVGLKTFYETEAMDEILSDSLYYVVQTWYQSPMDIQDIFNW